VCDYSSATGSKCGMAQWMSLHACTQRSSASHLGSRTLRLQTLTAALQSVEAHHTAAISEVMRMPAVVVSFTFGVKGAGDVIHSAGLAAPGLIILVAGIAGIALNGQVATRRHETQGECRYPPPSNLCKLSPMSYLGPADWDLGACHVGSLP
jgi:hypothetical protein